MTSIQSRKHLKQTEIAVREMTRKLADIMQRGDDDQPPVQAAIDRLERVRDELLLAMFPERQEMSAFLFRACASRGHVAAGGSRRHSAIAIR